ncbi:PREDICTED: E3 ubiquitin-protein ligase TTC3 isoform X4 [Gavialis gangeticus]|uniref:E3 ubiquitin-protein ligase TTC3 isoform X4 n=1 Tax=Gavialis gangeticus TaxID=94835 RepID=UPI00092ED392|nr:PREDICTED: E3 ubiquitin-protein ligase TTC3 isoform X4 [Gavialis gangeticus]
MEKSLPDSEFAGIAFYGGCIKPCCQLARDKFRKHSSNKLKLKTGVDPCTVWCSKPVEVLREYCDVVKKYIFWPLLFRIDHMLSDWFVADNHLEYSGSHLCELSLKRLWHIEVLEDIVDLAKKVVNDPFFINGILRIGTRIENKVFDVGDALEWVKYTGEFSVLEKLKKLGDYCWPPLEVFFAEYKNHITRVALEDCNLVEEFEAQSCENCKRESEFMKKRGNSEFSQRNWHYAIIFYTKAIEYCPENHLLYSNRALCFLLTGEYRRALGDGKRAIILKPSWPKGHYRFCDALSLLGEHEQAMVANERAQELCKNSPEGLKDLIQQNTKLRKKIEEIKGGKQSKHKPKKPHFEKKDSGSSKPNLFTSQEPKETHKEKRTTQSDSKDQSCNLKHDIKVSTDTLSKENNSELPSGQNHQNKGKPKNKTSVSEKAREHLNLKIDSKNVQDKFCSAVRQVDSTTLPEMLKSLVCDGYTALMDQRCRSAEQAFSQLMNILDPSELKKLNLAVIDYVVIIYGHATALLGIGQPEELAKAEDEFNKVIEQYQKERFNCLAHYGIGKVYFRQNRFSDALDQFLKSQTMVNHKIVPGVLTWPTTSVVIQETRPEMLQLMLKDYIEECKFPPAPDAVCRYQECSGHSKIQIYFTDPDFKGFIRLTCCQQCKVEFHIGCWKKLKTTIYNDRNDKDFLQEVCFTPDCSGLISKIVIFSSSGLVKCEFEEKITKTKDPPKASIKQKCSSCRKLKIKQDKKLRRKYVKEEMLNSVKERVEENQKENSESKRDHKGHIPGECLFAGDGVLQYIIQNAEQIKTGVYDTSKLLSELLSWWIISKEDYTAYSINSSLSNQVMEQLISYLIQEKNRVKTRIFIHVLSEFEELDPKLHEWVKHLNNFGLKAAENFFSSFGHLVEKLDLSFITSLWNEKYGRKLGCVVTSTEDKEILNYFHEAALEEARCVIWLLEDNREKFPSLHHALDVFFDIMDDPCVIIKKQENEDISTNGIKVKNKNKKKKSKESKQTILVLSGGVGALTHEEDAIFAEENTLSFMNPYEPFIIPEYLRDQVEEFEALHGSISDSDDYQRFLDNNPDPTCASLYDYFSQILEEHGPMEIDDKLLVGEYEHFPEEAHKIVENAGGLKPFLLRSVHFVLVDNCIGLMKHAILLKGNADILAETKEDTRNEEENCIAWPNIQGNSSKSKLQLNPAAKEFKPVSYINKPYMPVPTDNTLASYETQECSAIGHSSHISYSSVHSLPNKSTDTIEEAVSFSNILLPSVIPNNRNILLTDSSVYQNERMLPILSQLPSVPNVASQPSYIYADYEAHLDIDETAISDRRCISGILLPNLMQTYQDTRYVVENLNFEFCGNNLDGVNNTSEAKYDTSAIKKEIENKNSSVVKNHPHTRMIAVQVQRELADREANTMPFHPFETQQGDILRMAKEHQVLQKQLKEAKEKYEQLQCRSTEETSVLKEQLKKNVEENKISKRELDWFHQDLETEIKKWQHEKKENQERLKAIKSAAKRQADTNEMYLRNIEEGDKQYKVILEEFLEISNKLANEKVKLEELIKKSKDQYQECAKRTVAAEVSVLENWKTAEVCKLCSIVSNAEANLKWLKVISSSSASPSPQLKSQIDEWETFHSDIKKEIEKVETQYEERIHMVKNGAVLNDLSKVQIRDLQPPPSVSVLQGRPPINDPAIVLCSSTPVHPNLLPPFSNPKDQSPVHSAPHEQSRNKTAHKSSNYSTNSGSVKILSETSGRSCSDQMLVAQPSEISGHAAPNIQLSHQDDPPPALAQLDSTRGSNKKVVPKAFDNIVSHLTTIFPHYTRFDLTNFIKEVRIKKGNTLSGLSQNEILSSVTELILDHQMKKKPAERPWRLVGETSKSTWKKSRDSSASEEDPCIICHEDLSKEAVCVLKCGHSFHRECIEPWLKTQRTCPTCRVHVLSSEEFPELPGKNRNA